MQTFGLSPLEPRLRWIRGAEGADLRVRPDSLPGKRGFHENLRQAFLGLIHAHAKYFERINKLEATVAALKRENRIRRSPDGIRKISRALADGVPMKSPRPRRGISESTFHEWRTAFPEFSEAIKRAEARGVHARLRMINRAARHGHKAAAWWLEHVHPEHFARNRIEHEHRGQVTVKSEMDMSKLSTDELKVYRAILLKGRASDGCPVPEDGSKLK